MSRQKLSKLDSKAAIRQLVEEYKRLFPQEFSDFSRGRRQKVSLLEKKTGEIKGNDVIHRPIAEWPATLETIFLSRLSREDEEFRRSKAGIRWFVREWPIFSAVEKV